MTYFLDFDRTILDTDSFTPSIADYPAVRELREQILEVASTKRDGSIRGQSGRMELWGKLNELCSEGKLIFAPGELSKFVFPDAVEFLKNHGNDSVILSFGHKSWIESKIESSLSNLPLQTVEYAHDREKGIALKSILKNYSAPYIVVDDLATQLDSIKEHCPEVSLFEIRRDGEAPSGRHAVIHSLLELP